MSDAPQLPAPSSNTTSSGFYQIVVLFVIFAVLMVLVISGGRSTPELADKDAEAPRAFFIEPSDGAEVISPFRVIMGVEGLTLEPAGPINENAGHFHILINVPFVEVGEIIPADAQHLHYGDARSETELSLEPGTYTLRLQFADGLHAATEYTDEITVTVVEAG